MDDRVVNQRKAQARREYKLHSIQCERCGDVFRSKVAEQESCWNCLEADHVNGEHDQAVHVQCSSCVLDTEVKK